MNSKDMEGNSHGQIWVLSWHFLGETKENNNIISHNGLCYDL